MRLCLDLEWTNLTASLTGYFTLTGAVFAWLFATSGKD